MSDHCPLGYLFSVVRGKVAYNEQSYQQDLTCIMTDMMAHSTFERQQLPSFVKRVNFSTQLINYHNVPKFSDR